METNTRNESVIPESSIEIPQHDYDSMEPIDFLDAMDEHFEKCKGKFNRLSIEWGRFSNLINTHLRGRMNSLEMGDPKRDIYLWIHAYWITQSHLLNLYLRTRIVVQNKMKRLAKEMRDYRRFVTTGKGPEVDEKQLFQKLLKGK